MVSYLLGRLLYGTLVLIGVITVVFLLFNVLPGDPARLSLGQRGGDSATLASVRKEMKLGTSLFFPAMYFILMTFRR